MLLQRGPRSLDVTLTVTQRSPLPWLLFERTHFSNSDRGAEPHKKSLAKTLLLPYFSPQRIHSLLNHKIKLAILFQKRLKPGRMPTFEVIIAIRSQFV